MLPFVNSQLSRHVNCNVVGLVVEVEFRTPLPSVPFFPMQLSGIELVTLTSHLFDAVSGGHYCHHPNAASPPG